MSPVDRAVLNLLAVALACPGDLGRHLSEGFRGRKQAGYPCRGPIAFQRVKCNQSSFGRDNDGPARGLYSREVPLEQFRVTEGPCRSADEAPLGVQKSHGFHPQACGRLVEVLQWLIRKERNDPDRCRLLGAHPFLAHFFRRLEHRIHRGTEPLVDAAVDQAEGEQEEEHGGHERNADQRQNQTRPELGSGLSDLVFDPQLDKVAGQHEAEDDQNEKNEGRESVEQEHFSGLGRADQRAEVERSLDEYDQGKHQKNQPGQIEFRCARR